MSVSYVAKEFLSLRWKKYFKKSQLENRTWCHKYLLLWCHVCIGPWTCGFMVVSLLFIARFGLNSLLRVTNSSCTLGMVLWKNWMLESFYHIAFIFYVFHFGLIYQLSIFHFQLKAMTIKRFTVILVQIIACRFNLCVSCSRFIPPTLIPSRYPMQCDVTSISSRYILFSLVMMQMAAYIAALAFKLAWGCVSKKMLQTPLL